VDYRVELVDPDGCRAGAWDEVPLLEATRGGPDSGDRVTGILPEETVAPGPGFRVRVTVAGRLFCEAPVTRVTTHQGDTRQLVFERYVHHHDAPSFEAVRAPKPTPVAGAFSNRDV